MVRRSDKPAENKEVLVFRPDDIPPGSCRLMRLGDKRVAVCRDEEGDKIRIYEVIED